MDVKEHELVLSKVDKPLAICDIDATVVIDDVIVPNIFDYFHPLVIDVDSLSNKSNLNRPGKIRFYKNGRLEKLKCWVINTDETMNALRKTISYISFAINYKRIMVTKAEYGESFWDDMWIES